ncbi:hypothetical protein J6590_024294 [Homalodisca vitripennis]|nr:hypothetical protein J6590_024294 [Homalodisca vitripennis]
MRASPIAASFVQSSPYHSSGPTPSTVGAHYKLSRSACTVAAGEIPTPNLSPSNANYLEFNYSELSLKRTTACPYSRMLL